MKEDLVKEANQEIKEEKEDEKFVKNEESIPSSLLHMSIKKKYFKKILFEILYLKPMLPVNKFQKSYTQYLLFISK